MTFPQIPSAQWAKTKAILLSLVLFVLCGLDLYAQDTIFSRIEKDYQLNFKKGGYHIYATLLGHNDKQIDTVFVYDYGVYKGIKVKDAVLHENVFMCVYQSLNGLFFINSALKDGKWSPLLGGYLFFLSAKGNNDYRVNIMSKEKVEVQQGTKGKKVIYLYDYDKKTVTISSH